MPCETIWEEKSLLIYTRGPEVLSLVWSVIESILAISFLLFSQIISQYLQSTHAPTHSDYTMTLLDVFEVEKEGEKEAFKEDLHNRSQFSFGKIFPSLKCSYRTKGRMAQRAVGFMLRAHVCRRAPETTIIMVFP